MRDKLKAMNGERTTFKGTFIRMGSKRDYNDVIIPTYLLENIMDMDDNLLTDHLWFNKTTEFSKLGHLHKGDVIQFDGRCKEYGKDKRWGEFGPEYTKFDYRISHPTKFKILSKASDGK